MAPLLTVYLVLHLVAGLALPYRSGFKPYFYKYIEDAGLDLERRLNRESRLQSQRIVRGAVVGVMLGALGVVAGFVIRAAGTVPYGFLLQFVFLAACINFMTPLKVVRQVQKHLSMDKGEPQAVAALQPYFQELLDPTADMHAVVRKTVEFIALSLNRFLLGPSFWLLAGGPVGMAVYVAFSAMNQSFGTADPRRRYFGSFVRFADKVLNIPSGALTAIFLAMGAMFVSRSSPIRAVATILRGGGKLSYREWILTAVAGGLGVTLGGPVRYSADYTEPAPWIGPQNSSARLYSDDLNRAALLQYIFYLCVLAMTALSMIMEAW